MKHPSLKLLLILTILVATGRQASGAPDNDSALPIPPVAAIPGITAEDRFPQACVDCHIDMPQINQDERLSTIMSRWYIATDVELLEKARRVAGENFDLDGKHPQSPDSFQNIPAACIACHDAGSAPRLLFAPLMHVIHLSRQDENHFLSIFQGECTHCHKFDANTGNWSIPSAPEQQR